MMTLIAVVHIIVALALIGLVLVQDSKGGGALGMGGGANSVLGATGAQTLAAKMTRWAAVIFAATSITLSLLTAQRSKSVLDSGTLPITAPTTTEATTAPTAAAPAADATATAPAQPAETQPKK